VLLAVGLIAVLLAGIGGSGHGSGASSSARSGDRFVTKLHVTVTPLGSLPAAVQDAAAAPLGGERYVLLGGLNAAGRSTDAVTVLSGGRTQQQSRLTGVQHDAQGAAVAGGVYIFGGGDLLSYDHILRYEPASGRVSSVGRLPQAQSDVAVTTIGDTAYIVGGYNGQQALNTIIAWRVGTPPRVVGRLPSAIRYAAVAAVGNRLVIAGGSESSGASDAIYSFDPGAGIVRRIGQLPSPTTHAAAAVVGGQVYVVGGRGDSTSSQTAAIVAVDPATGRTLPVGSLPRAISDEAAVSTGSAIVIAGGHTSAGATAAISRVAPRQVRVRIPAPPKPGRARSGAPASAVPGVAGAPTPPAAAAFRAASKLSGLPGYLLIADRGNNRLLLVNSARQIVWRFPTVADRSQGRRLLYNDDAFVAPGGGSIVANEEDNHAIVSIGVASHRLDYLFGVPGVKGGGSTHLNTPDDAYPLADGSAVVADAYNCRVLYIRARQITRQIGTDGVCRHDPPRSFGAINGDTPTPDGGLLVSEIPGSFVDSIAADGSLRYSVHAPVAYPSDPQPMGANKILLADYASPGQVMIMSRRGFVLWRYRVTQGPGRLDHPSLAFELPNGNISVNDDYRHRVVIIDPHTKRIVWQYGLNDVPGTGPNRLNTPDGMDFVPAASDGTPFWAAVHHP
jgi:hypothetical protein